MLTDVWGRKKKHTKIDRRKKEWENNKMEGRGKDARLGRKWEEEIRVGQKRRGKKNVKEGEKKGRKKKSDS